MFSKIRSTSIIGASYRLYLWIAQSFHKKLLQRRGDPDPGSVLSSHMTDPTTIEFYSGRNYKNCLTISEEIGEIRGGDWDRGDLRPVRGIDYDGYSGNSFNDFIYTSILNRYCNGRAWTKTNAYQFALQKIKSGDSVWHGCQTEEDIRSRCADIDALFENISSNGFQSFRSRVMSGKELPRPMYRCLRREVVVDQGRNGEFLFVDGIHRLCIAKILNLDQIPVQIVTRHKNATKSTIQS